MGTSVPSCVTLKNEASRSGLIVQVGNNRRFDPGVAFASSSSARNGAADRVSAWYYDSVYRYTMTDNLQPIPLEPAALRPASGK